MDHLSNFHHSDLLHTQEAIRHYRSSGFHPVRLDDTFKDGRYQVRHKLGWGGFSTVWLARDHVYVQTSAILSHPPDNRKLRLKKWVSLKITVADAPRPSRELQILQHLRQKRAARRIVQLLDHFIHQGPNGCHQCLVFELLGPSIDHVVADYDMGGDRLEAPTILKITRQLMQAIAAMHAAGYAHGGLFWHHRLYYLTTHLTWAALLTSCPGRYQRLKPTLYCP
jgi:serine/threonine-protein kinase SRPK3